MRVYKNLLSCSTQNDTVTLLFLQRSKPAFNYDIRLWL